MNHQPKAVATPEQWKGWEPYFYETEFRSPDIHIARMDPDFMALLFTLRRRVGIPFHITSGYRTERHNAQIGGGRHSAHIEGCAADVRVDVPHMHDVIAAAIPLGFTGIGIRGLGPWNHRFLHLDTAPSLPGLRPRPWIWSYGR